MRSLALPLLLTLVACGPVRSSMISYDALRSDRQARFFVDGDMLVMEAHDTSGLAIVTYDPWLDDEDRVVLNAGIVSSGSDRVRVHCFDVAPLSPREGWEDRLFWREPSGGLARITELERGPEARERAEQCRARRHPTST